MQETRTQTVPEKKYFLAKLIAPRPDFATTMTPVEAKVMQEHGAYLTGYVEKGTVIVMGPVLDPAGAWGLAVFEAVPNRRSGPSSHTTRRRCPASGSGGRYPR